MARILFLLSWLLFPVGQAWTQVAVDISGKWSMDQVQLMDTLVKSEERIFHFDAGNFTFGKKNRKSMIVGTYSMEEPNFLTLYPSEEVELTGKFTVVPLPGKSERVMMRNDSLTLYLSRYFLPSDFKQDPRVSKIEELEGWNQFKSEHFELALDHFKTAYLKDSTNYDAITGLLYSEGAVQGRMNFDLIELVSQNTEQTHEELGLTTAAFMGKYASTKGKYYADDLSPESISAFYTGGPFSSHYQNGNSKEKGQFRDKKPFGKWMEWREDGTLLKTTEFSNSDSTKTYTFHKPDGEMAIKEVMKDEGEFQTTLKRIVYYQELPDDRGTYLFVSKKGFCVIDKSKSISFDATTPDNVIEEGYDLEKGTIWYIWKNGKRTIYRDCPLDGTIVIDPEGDNRMNYVWKDCKKVFIESQK